MSSITRLSLAVLVIFFLGGSAAWSDTPDKIEIGRQAKSATVYIEIAGRRSGTGFCIHPSGLLVTNDHVIRGARDTEITVVFDPALPTQRVLPASVLRVDAETDLALLRVIPGNDLPSLPLGTIAGIAELTEVISCGFPLGRKLATDKKEYPAVSVNRGTVTAMRYKDGKLLFIQTDVAINFGNSGGPLLDSNGKVIGVVVSKAAGATGINQAIPVSLLERFLKAPVLSLQAPQLSRENLTQPQSFKAQAISVFPDTPEPQLKLILKAGDAEAREFPMQKRPDGWIGTAAAAEMQSSSRVIITAQIGSGSVTGTTENKVIRIGEVPKRLSEIRSIEWTSAKQAEGKDIADCKTLLVDGVTILDGRVKGPDRLNVELGGQQISLDMSKIAKLSVQSVAEASFVSASIVATVNGSEVARLEMKLPIREFRATQDEPPPVTITPPTLPSEPVVKSLPAPFSDVVPAGDGRYLVFHLPKLRKVAIFDFNAAQITKYLPLTEDDIVLAAGRDCVVIGLRESGMLQRWNLATSTMERSAPPPFKESLSSVILGHGSDGPLVVNGFFLDLSTFRPLPIRDQKGNERAFSAGYRIPSADGSVFGAWKTNQSPDESTVFVVEGNTVKRYDAQGLKHVVPGPDGKTIYTANGICSTTLKRFDRDDAAYGYCLPAVRGGYFLSLTSASSGKAGFTIYHRGLSLPIMRLDKFNHGLSFDGWDRESFGPWRRVFFVPDAQLIAVLPQTNDQIALYKFDAEAALEKSGQDYLIVTSKPPHRYEPGSEFTYAVKVKSKPLQVQHKLEVGPQGMVISPEGLISWKPDQSVSGDQDVILTLRNANGQEVFHTFTLRSGQ